MLQRLQFIQIQSPLSFLIKHAVRENTKFSRKYNTGMWLSDTMTMIGGVGVLWLNTICRYYCLCQCVWIQMCLSSTFQNVIAIIIIGSFVYTDAKCFMLRLSTRYAQSKIILRRNMWFSFIFSFIVFDCTVHSRLQGTDTSNVPYHRILTKGSSTAWQKDIHWIIPCPFCSVLCCIRDPFSCACSLVMRTTLSAYWRVYRILCNVFKS